jgi:hypothetical protein
MGQTLRESCFDTGDEQEETDADTEPVDVNTDIHEDDEVDTLRFTQLDLICC